LAQRDLLPAEHLVDAGYTSTALLVTSATRYGIDLVGPLPADTSWQTRADEGFDVQSFYIDWDTHTATCPHGKQRAYAERSRERAPPKTGHVRRSGGALAVCLVPLLTRWYSCSTRD
jgi:hypothetical protein